MPIRCLRALLATLLLTLGVAAPSVGQVPSRWLFRSSATADLWYHGVALTGYTGFGAQPLYDPGYPARVRQSREASGVPATALEREGAALREAFTADSAFELLHFVPLYLPASDPDELLDVIDAVAREGRAAVARLPERARFGAATVASVLASPAERATLGRFARALREEWGTYRGERAAAAGTREAQLAAASRAWQEAEPAMRTFLAAERLDGGIVLGVPALGAEGRLFAGRPDERADNIVAVAMPHDADGEAVAWLAVKELAFPAARRALEAAGQMPAGRVEAERRSGAAAAELGALVLGGASASLAGRYRSAVAGVSGCRSFAACFSLPDAAASALRDAAR